MASSAEEAEKVNQQEKKTIWTWSGWEVHGSQNLIGLFCSVTTSQIALAPQVFTPTFDVEFQELQQ